MAGRDWRRGFWRLAAVFWVVGALALTWWNEEARRGPLADVCRPEIDPPYAECFTEAARRLAESESLTERLTGRFRQGWEGIDRERVVPRWQSARYREALASLGWRQLAWALLVWVPFYAGVWAFAGFRRREPS